jgi:enamine deaminase RidA (YjgF/YER057c/UK114 family)
VPTLSVSHHQIAHADQLHLPAVYDEFSQRRWERIKQGVRALAPTLAEQEVHDVAMHALLELDWIAVVDPNLSQAEAASWLAPLGHAPELTESGPFVILNGVTAEGATLGEQSYGVLAKAGRILSEAGSGIEHLVKMTVVIADFDSYPQFNQATQAVFADITPPTRSVVVAPHLTGAHLLRVDFLALRGP